MSPTRILAAVLPAVAVVLLAWLLVWSPRSAEKQAEESRAADLHTQLAVQTRTLEKTRRFAAEGRRAGEQLDTLRAAVPDEVDLGSFVALNDEAARAAGVTLLSLTPDPPATEDPSAERDDAGTAGSAPAGLRAVGITLTVRGERARVADYLGRLTALARATSVDEVSTTVEGDGQTSSTVRLRIFSF